MSPRAGLDECGKSRPTGIRSPDRPARSESLYRLSYPGLRLKVGFTISQTTKALREGRGIALLYFRPLH